MMSLDEAILLLRAKPEYEDLVRDAYLGDNVFNSAQRFTSSPEFTEVRRLLGKQVKGATILDIGAGSGISSYGLIKAGATHCYALEPDPSNLVGLGAIQSLIIDQPITPLQAVAENIPLPDACVDIVYARQVLHHTSNLYRAINECARVLRPGGIFLACREHVVRNTTDLKNFLDSHIIHQLAGGENAYKLREYIGALKNADFKSITVLKTFESVINYWPIEPSQLDITRLSVKRRNLPKLLRRLTYLPILKSLIFRVTSDYYAGNMYSFIAHKSN